MSGLCFLFVIYDVPMLNSSEIWSRIRRATLFRVYQRVVSQTLEERPAIIKVGFFWES